MSMSRLHSASWRRWLVLLVLAVTALGGSFGTGADKFNAQHELGFRHQIPSVLGDWRNTTPSDHVPGAGVNFNEIFQGLYEHPELGRVALTIEYTSDSRRQFELHYPDVCHEVRGDRVVSYPSSRLQLPEGAAVEAALMSWHRPDNEYQALTAYWYVTRAGVTTDTLRLKWAQALSGLIQRPSEAVMVRLDAFYDPAEGGGQRPARLRAIADMTMQLSRAIGPGLHRPFFERLDEETS